MKIDWSLSYTQIKTWRECRAHWYYKYFCGYQPKVRKTTAMRGSLIHHGMKRALLSDTFDDRIWSLALRDWCKEWRTDETEYVVEPGWLLQQKTSVASAYAYFRREWSVLADQEGELCVERRMNFDLPYHFRGLTFIPDVVGVRRVPPYEGQIFSIDFKAYGKPRPEEAGVFDLQGALYQLYLRRLGIDAIGSCLFQFSPSQRPPRVNKDGSLHAGDVAAAERWQAISSAPPIYRSEEYLLGLNREVFEPAIQEMAWAANWILNSMGVSSRMGITPAVDYFPCSFCDYVEPCQAYLRGLDEGAILASEFTTKGGIRCRQA